MIEYNSSILVASFSDTNLRMYRILANSLNRDVAILYGCLNTVLQKTMQFLAFFRTFRRSFVSADVL